MVVVVKIRELWVEGNEGANSGTVRWWWWWQRWSEVEQRMMVVNSSTTR